MEIRNLISITDFSVEEIDKMIGVAGDIMKNPDKYIDICKGKKLATLFFEPSTRDVYKRQEEACGTWFWS